MRLLVPGTALLLLSLPLFAQSSETGGDPDDNAPPRAKPVASTGSDMGDPGASQDAEAEREKLLKASTQLDNIEANSESTKQSLEGMKSDLAKLQADNAALKQQVSTLQDTITKQQDQMDQIKADRAKDRQAIIDEVSSLVASKPAPHHSHPAPSPDEAAASSTDSASTPPPPAPKKHHVDADAADSSQTMKPVATTPSLSPPPDSAAASGPVKDNDTAAATDSTPPAPASSGDSAASATPTAPSHPHKGWYHVVAPHETLSLICEAYRGQGVNVTLSQIRHANGLTAKTPLKVGQKLFIPKPGT